MKIAVPRQSAGYLSRPRLVETLDGAAEQEVVLLCAPAGYGKTLLLADWSANDLDRTAWVSLDEGDNDDQRFWSAVVAALTTCPAVPADSRVHRIEVPTTPSRDQAFLAELLDALTHLSSRIRLILDDVHELTAADPLHGLGCLVRDWPRGQRLVLATRSDPPLHLSRLRLAERLCEIRADSLAFSLAEASVLVSSSDLVAGPGQVKVLLEQTAGWPAGLRLAVLSLRESGDPETFLKDLVGNGRAISDYLVTEIMSRFTDEVREFLYCIAVSDELTVPLAVALSGQADAGELLTAVERETSLVVSYGGGRRWFRVHPLLRSHLRAEVRRTRPEVKAGLHATAARWFDGAGQPILALRHARSAGDVPLVGDLLRRHGAAMATSGGHGAILDAFDVVGVAAPPDPWIELVGALAALEIGDATAMSVRVSRAESAWPDPPAPELEALRAHVIARFTWMAEAGQLGPEEQDFERIVGAESGSAVGLFLRANSAVAAGRLEEAEVIASAAADRAVREGNSYLAARSLTTQAVATGYGGDINRMVEVVEQSERSAPPESWHSTEGEALNAVMSAYGALMQHRPQRCLDVVAKAVGFATGLRSRRDGAAAEALMPLIDILRATARFDLGEGHAAAVVLRVAREAIPPGAARFKPAALSVLFEHGVTTRLGRQGQTRAVLDWAEQHLQGTGELAFLRAAGPAGIRRFPAAREQLRPLLDGSAVPVVPWALTEGWLLDCDIALALGSRPRAREALRQALSTAQEFGCVRPLVYASDEVAALLSDQLGAFGDLDETARTALSAHRSREHLPALTEREQAVLALLPSQRSLEEIADDLAVSINTVKSHVKAVYSKLGANSRRSAVAAAQRHGLTGGGGG